MELVIVGLSAAFLLAAVVLTLRLYPVSGNCLVWLLLAGAFLLLALEALADFFQLARSTGSTGAIHLPDLTRLIAAVLVATAMWLLYEFIGVIRDAQLRHEDDLARQALLADIAHRALGTDTPAQLLAHAVQALHRQLRPLWTRALLATGDGGPAVVAAEGTIEDPPEALETLEAAAWSAVNLQRQPIENETAQAGGQRICLPLAAQGRAQPRALLCLRSRGELTPGDEDFLRAVADVLSTAMAAAESRESLRDSHLDLEKHYFSHRQALEQAQASHQALAAQLADLQRQLTDARARQEQTGRLAAAVRDDLRQWLREPLLRIQGQARLLKLNRMTGAVGDTAELARGLQAAVEHMLEQVALQIRLLEWVAHSPVEAGAVDDACPAAEWFSGLQALLQEKLPVLSLETEYGAAIDAVPHGERLQFVVLQLLLAWRAAVPELDRVALHMTDTDDGRVLALDSEAAAPDPGLADSLPAVVLAQVWQGQPGAAGFATRTTWPGAPSAVPPAATAPEDDVDAI